MAVTKKAAGRIVQSDCAALVLLGSPVDSHPPQEVLSLEHVKPDRANMKRNEVAVGRASQHSPGRMEG